MLTLYYYRDSEAYGEHLLARDAAAKEIEYKAAVSGFDDKVAKLKEEMAERSERMLAQEREMLAKERKMLEEERKKSSNLAEQVKVLGKQVEALKLEKDKVVEAGAAVVKDVEGKALWVCNSILKSVEDALPAIRAEAVRDALWGPSHHLHLLTAKELQKSEGFDLAVAQLRHLGVSIPEEILAQTSYRKTRDLGVPQPSTAYAPTATEDEFDAIYVAFDEDLADIQSGEISGPPAKESTTFPDFTSVNSSLVELGWSAKKDDADPPMIVSDFAESISGGALLNMFDEINRLESSHE